MPKTKDFDRQKWPENLFERLPIQACVVGTFSFPMPLGRAKVIQFYTKTKESEAPLLPLRLEPGLVGRKTNFPYKDG